MEPVAFDTILDKFRYVAARESLNPCQTQEIIDLANDALSLGLYHDALLAIIDARPAIKSQIADPLNHFCQAYEIPIGNRDWSIRYVLRHYLSRMARADLDPNKEFYRCRSAMGEYDIFRRLRSGGQSALHELNSLEIQYDYELYNSSLGVIESKNDDAVRSEILTELRNAAQRCLCELNF